MSIHLGRFVECCGVLLTTEFAYRKGLGTCGRKARIVLIDFSAAFDMVNHLGILYNLCYVGIGGLVLSVLTQFLSNRSHHVMVDGCGSKLVNVVSGVPQGNVLDRLLFLLYTSELFSIRENKLISYADDYFVGCCAISRH